MDLDILNICKFRLLYRYEGYKWVFVIKFEGVSSLLKLIMFWVKLLIFF